MEHYVGTDVFLELSSVGIVDVQAESSGMSGVWPGHSGDRCLAYCCKTSQRADALATLITASVRLVTSNVRELL
jgi:hypothetical protein